MSYVVGIDLGTTFTAAAVADDAGTRMVSLAHDRVAVPSVVAPTENGFLVGDEAAAISSTMPWNVAREFKRRFGDPTPMYINGEPHAPEALMAQLLRWVLARVSELQGGVPSDIVVTHPATWGTFKQDLLRSAAAAIDLPPFRLLAEPAAAAIHYHDRHRVADGETITVYDMGGGTFDVSILERTGLAYAIRSAGGLERAGGLDLDDAVFRLVIEAIQSHFDQLDTEDLNAQRAVARLREECTRAKIGLSFDTKVVVPVVLPGLVTEVLVQRSEFEDRIARLIDDTITATETVVAQARLAGDPSKVLLVGGSSRVPLVTQRLTQALGVPVVVDTHPKHAVALGAVGSLAPEQSEADVAAPIDATPESEVQELPTATVRFEPGEVDAASTQRFAIVLTGSAGGRVIELADGTTTLGRDDRDGIIGLGNRLVSRRHAALQRRGTNVTIADLGSTNGTVLDGATIGSEPVTLEPGAIIDIAGTLVLLDGPGARLESPPSILSAWRLPPAPSGGIGHRLRKRSRSEEWITELEQIQPALADLTARLQVAHRLERPSSAVLQAWSTHLPERLASVASDAGAVVLGWADFASPLAGPIPEGLSDPAHAAALELLGAHRTMHSVPLVVPLLGLTTVIDHRGPEAEAMARSIMTDLRLASPSLVVTTSTDTNGNLADIRVGLDPERTTLSAPPVSDGGRVLEGRVVIGTRLDGAEPAAVVTMTDVGAVYRRDGVDYPFHPATLAD